MAYGIKYQISYYRKSEGQTTIDILEKDYSGAITTLKAANNPLEISFDGDVGNLYKPTVGTGATITFVAIPLTMQSLFTDDPQKYIVNIYNGESKDSSGATNIIWQGFVNTGIYTESYSTPIILKSLITIHCNDGMQILDKIIYADNGTSYTGTSTIGEVFTNIFDKLEIDFNEIRTSIDICLDTDEKNIFLYGKVINANYYDENSKPMSCRDVLNSIFGGLGLVMRLMGDCVYIFDPINLHDTTKGNKYDFDTFVESAYIDLGGFVDISLGEIKWGKTGSVSDIVSRLFEIETKYDPYTIIDITYDFNDENNWDFMGAWAYPAGYCYNSSPEFTNWTQSAGTHFIGIKETETDNPVFVLYLTNTGDVLTYITTQGFYYDAGLSLKITFQAYFQTRVNSPNIYSDNAANPIYSYYIQYSIKIGDQYWKDDHWETGETGNYKRLLIVKDWEVSVAQYVADNTISQVGDVWAEARDIVKLHSATVHGGVVTIVVYDYWTSVMINRKEFSPIYALLLKDLSIEVLDANNNSINNDGVSKKATISTNVLYKKEVYEIPLTNGIGPYGVSRGAFLDVDDIPLTGMFRIDESILLDTDELFLQSITSQYKQSRFKITGTLDVVDYLLSITTKLIQDTDYSGTKAFYIVKGTYKDREETFDVEMLEIEDTREPI